MTKILVHTNSPEAKSGYGVQCALLVERLADDGHEVAVSTTYGHPSGLGVGTYRTKSGKSVRVYPSWGSMTAEDVVYAHARSFFGDDDNGWIIFLLDIWAMTGKGCEDHNVVGWTPVDHDPLPPIVAQFYDRAPSVIPLAMSRHGQAELSRSGIDAAYVPLAVDTKVYKPTFTTVQDGKEMTGREYFGLPDGAFVVGVVGMNKDPNDRKGFQEAMMGFAEFHKTHPNAILHLHTDRSGVFSGMELAELADACGIPPTAMSWTNQYAYVIGFPPHLMALLFTAFDCVLAPSGGEGFGVPLIEAQACGVPVIVNDFTAQPELVGAGWKVGGQRWYDHPSKSWYLRANVGEVAAALEQAYDSDLEATQQVAIDFAKQYDADYVFDTYWRPYLRDVMDNRPPADQPLMTDVAVLVPAMKRPGNVKRLVDSFNATNDGTASLYYICDPDDADQIEAVEAADANVILAKRGTSFASKINEGYDGTEESWIFVTGDDVEFTDGWIEAARLLSDRYDVIGTNDSEAGRVRNPKVASGNHSDHFFVRRSYVDDEGSSLEGPGIVLAEAYFHYYTDVETIQLAKALGKFTPCLDSHVIHHHPGYDGREDLREADPVYMHAVEYSQDDARSFNRRRSLIDQRKTVRRDIWR